MLYSKTNQTNYYYIVQSNTYAGRGSLTAGNNPLNNAIIGSNSAGNAGVSNGNSNLIMQTSY
jgi:hypothetical protein